MNIETKEQALELVVKSIPYPEHIKDWDLSSEETSIRFTWRTENRFRFDFKYMSVEEVGNGVLSGTNITILLRELLKRAACQ